MQSWAVMQRQRRQWPSCNAYVCEPCHTHAGCDLDYIPADSTLSFTQGDFYQCNGEPAQRYLLGYYSREVCEQVTSVAWVSQV
jgi:hypothetical protein